MQTKNDATNAKIIGAIAEALNNFNPLGTGEINIPPWKIVRFKGPILTFIGSIKSLAFNGILKDNESVGRDN